MNWSRRVTLGLACSALAGLLGISTVLLALPASASSPVQTTPDTQVYTSTLATSDYDADPYYPDSNAIHIGVSGGTATYWAYVHVDFGAVGGVANVTSLSVSFTEYSDSSEPEADTNASSAKLQACIDTQPIPSGWTGNNSADAPQYQCSTSAPIQATMSPDGTVWSFDLGPMLQTWQSSADDGFAIVPLSSSPSDNWMIAFEKGKSIATMTTSGTSGSSPSLFGNGGVSAPPPAPPISGGGVPSVSGGVPSVGAPAVPASTPSPAPRSSRVAGASGSRGSGPTTIAVQPHWGALAAWVWTLLATGALALVAVAFFVGRALGPAGAAGRALALPSGGSLFGAMRQVRPQLAFPVLIGLLGASIAFGYTTPAFSSSGGSSGGASSSLGGSASSAASGASGPTLPGGTGPASGGGAASGAAYRPTGSAAGTRVAALAGCGSAPQTPVPIGLWASQSTTNNAEAFGTVAEGQTKANPVQEVQAILDWINAHQGVACHEAVLKYEQIPYDESNPENTYHDACITMTQQDHVFAALEYDPENDFGNMQCYADNHTLALVGDAMYTPTEADLQKWAPYVFMLMSPSEDRKAALQISGLEHAGFFGTGTVLAVLGADEPEFRQTYSNITLPALEALGFKENVNLYPFWVNPGTGSENDDANAISAMQSDAVQMRADGVNHIIFVGGAASGTPGALSFFFQRGAAGQQFYPRYGLISDDCDYCLATEGDSTSQNNTVTVGYAPWADVLDDVDPYPGTPAEKLCKQIQAITHQDVYMDSRLDAAQMQVFCDQLLTLYFGAHGLAPNQLSDANVAYGIQHLGTSLQLGLPEYTDFRPGHYDASGGYSYLAFSANCCPKTSHVNQTANGYVYTDRNVYTIPG